MIKENQNYELKNDDYDEKTKFPYNFYVIIKFKFSIKYLMNKLRCHF